MEDPLPDLPVASRPSHSRKSSLFDDLESNVAVDTGYSSGYTIGKKLHRGSLSHFGRFFSCASRGIT